MATRFYFPASTAADVSPAFNASFNSSVSAIRRKLALTKGSSTIADGTTIAASGSAGRAGLDRMYVSDPLAQQTISGTLKGQLLVRELAANDDLNNLIVSVRVCSYDGSTFRGTLLAYGNYGPATEYSTSNRNKTFADGDALSSLAILAGDRLVIELGHAPSAGGTTPQAVAQWGENGTDLPEDETTTTGNGWIEFSGTIALAPENIFVKPVVGPAHFPPREALRGRARLGRGVSENLPDIHAGAFIARGYITTNFRAERGAPLGVFEIDKLAETHAQPYLGIGPATNITARGVLELTSGWNRTAMLGIERIVIPDVAGLYYVFPRVVPAHFPPREVMRGRSRLGRGFAEDYVPNPRSVLQLRIARTVPPWLDWLRGRARLGRGISADILFTDFSPQGVRVSRPPQFPREILRGRSRLGRGVPENLRLPVFALQLRVVRPPKFPVAILRGRSRLGRGISQNRIPSEISLEQPILVRAAAELSLHQDLDAFTAAGYRVIARDVETGVETELGFAAPSGGVVTLSGVAIADGHYMLRVEANGRYWRAARFAQEWPVTIIDGELEQALPAVLNLTANTVGSSVFVTWTCDPSGAATPEDFGVWTSATSPVDTSGAPSTTAAFAGAAGYLVELTSSPTLIYVAVAARLGVQVGPVSETTVVVPGVSLSSPSGPSARIRDWRWLLK